MQVMTTLERKYHQPDQGLLIHTVDGGCNISGYASLFGVTDQGGDRVAPGAFAASLARLQAKGGKVRMLWQHDPAQPIGIWDEVREDRQGLWVKGRLLQSVAKGREAAALLEAGAIDGLSIGYRTLRAERDAKGLRLLHELDLWEVSLVTFPMLPDARIAEAKDDAEGAELIAILRDLTLAFSDARRSLRTV